MQDARTGNTRNLIMPTLLLPTRNRPGHLLDLFEFLKRFYPKTKLLVADGSDDDIKGRNRQTCDSFAGYLDIDLRAYPPDVDLVDRMIDALDCVDDEFVAQAADDDYPMMDTYVRAAEILKGLPGYSCVVPYDIVISLRPDQSVIARLSPARDVRRENAQARVNEFARMSFPTSYSVAHKDTLAKRYASLKRVSCAGFFDFQVGLEDCISGKIAALPELGCIRTQSYVDNHIRPADSLFFLRKGQTILRIAEMTTERLAAIDGVDYEQAKRTLTRAVRRRISELTGNRALRRGRFLESKAFLNATLQAQFESFYLLFEEDNVVRDRYIDQLRTITEMLFRRAEAADGKSGQNYEEL